MQWPGVEGCAGKAAACALQELPGFLGSLKRLKILAADQNRITSVSPALLGGCTSLATLTLHENPITFEVTILCPASARSFLFIYLGHIAYRRPARATS